MNENLHRLSTLNNMFPQNGVKRASRYVFSHLVGVSEMLPNQQQCKEWPSQLPLYYLAVVITMVA